MTTAATIPMKWHTDEWIPGEQCSCCGRALREGRETTYWVEVINGGADVAAPGLGPDTDDPGYMGFHEVGPTCAKKNFPGFFHKEVFPHEKY